MPSQASILKRLGEVVLIDVVLIQEPHQDSKIIVTIWIWQSAIRVGSAETHQDIPIKGVSVRIFVTRCSIVAGSGLRPYLRP
jgi:hypothetical protein